MAVEAESRKRILASEGDVWDFDDVDGSGGNLDVHTSGVHQGSPADRCNLGSWTF